MKKLKVIILIFVFSFSLSQKTSSQTIPGSFADLAEKLMPSVVNISTTQTVVTKSNPFPGFEFLQARPLRICLKILVHLKKDNHQPWIRFYY